MTAMLRICFGCGSIHDWSNVQVLGLSMTVVLAVAPAAQCCWRSDEVQS